jgi:CHAD domain-containing protein
MHSRNPAPDATASELFAWMFGRFGALIAATAPGTLTGEDPEQLHRMRTSTRRLRACLKLCGGVLPEREARALQAELAWLARTLGPVRDLDVMTLELPRLLAGHPEPLPGLLGWLRGRWVEARRPLPPALDSARFEALLAWLERAAIPGHGGTEADRVAADLLAPRLERRLVQLYDQAAAILPENPDAQLHRLRILGKKLRYGCELAEPVLPVAPFAPTLRVPHQLLGEHQDASVASEWIAAYAAAHPRLSPSIPERWEHLLASERRRLRACFMERLPSLRRTLGDPHAAEPEGLAAALKR